MKAFTSSSLTLLALLLGSERTHGEQRNLIQDGTSADRKEYPYFTQGSGCGASLIWKDILLTAAHCQGRFADVLIGARESQSPDRFSQTRSGEIEILHPDYDGAVYMDYMIVVLDTEVTNHHISMVGLAGDDTPLTVGDELTAMGFGDTAQHIDGIQGSKTLQEVNLHYVSDQECAIVYGGEPSFNENYMFCARSTSEDSKADTCGGDSGGPLVNQDGYQVGITSWGHADGCGFRHLPGVYATVSSEIEWIKETVCQYASNPPAWACDGGTSSVPPSDIPFNFVDWVQRQKSSTLLICLAVIVNFTLLYLCCRKFCDSKDDNGENEKEDDSTVGEEDLTEDTEAARAAWRTGQDTMPDVEYYNRQWPRR